MSKLSEIDVKRFLSELSLKCVDVIENATNINPRIYRTIYIIER
jgi:hypothetical protein